ncbi:serine/threonine-protein kinase nak1 [Apiospora sp. TS-2023a]
MAHLSVRFEPTIARQKATDDARKMQEMVEEDCAKEGKPIPAYDLMELIGKGSFGRVYKATNKNDGKLVAVKIINVDESDTVNPKLADTYSEFLKEVNALQVLSEGGAQNINCVLEALPVGHAMWMVTEYCAGGSVATLMKPTAPGGLQEKGIIHRDIKCANVLVMEDGGVQLCDFGVAGMMETKFDKRSTFIGTPHWMAPELFDPNAQYGTEVDIWAFGSMVFEIASGLPPNVGANVGLTQFGGFLREHIPRLEGDQYSPELKSLVAYCLEESPAQRPTVQQAYKLWEERGGSRKSLFNPNIGAQGPSDLASTSMAPDEWNFSTTLAFDQQIHDNSDGLTDFEAVRDVYGSQIDFPIYPDEGMGQGKAKGGRRRPPPQALAAMKAPLEKVFDPNTISNYVENSQAYYGHGPMPPPPPPLPPVPVSDLPLRDDSLHATLRESLIDLDMSLGGADISSFMDMDTIKAGPVPRNGPRQSMDHSWSFSGASNADSQYDQDSQYNRDSQYDRAPSSDPEQTNTARHTQAWQWPTTIPPASANPEVSSFSFNDEFDDDMATRPPLLHQSTEPAGLPSQGYELQVPRSTNDRMSVSSLIDLDEGLVDNGMPELTRPSTANSDVPSIAGSDMGGLANPFELERHTSVYAPMSMNTREPSIYVSDDSEYATVASKVANDVPDLASIGNGDQTVRLQHNGHMPSDGSQTYVNDSESEYMMQGSTSRDDMSIRHSNGGGPSAFMDLQMPSYVAPPSASVMEARAMAGDVTDEMRRLIGSLSEHLTLIGNQVGGMEPKRASQRLSGGNGVLEHESNTLD